MEDSKSKKTSQKNQKVMMKISSSNNNNIVSFILLGGAAALGAFLLERNRRKSSNNITKNEKIKEEESSKGPCMHHHHPSSNGTEKLGVNDSTSLFSTPYLSQDEKPELEMDDEKGENLDAVVCDHPKEEEKSQSLERLELSEAKTSLLPGTNQGEVSEGNEETEVPHLHQPQDTIFCNPSLLVDDKSEFLVDEKHIDKGEVRELQHTDMIKTDNDEGLVQERQLNQEIFRPDGSCEQNFLPIQFCSLPLFDPEQLKQDDRAVETIELKNAHYEDDGKGNMQIMHFEEQFDDAETQSDQIAKKRNQQMQLSDEQNCSKENNQAISSLEHSPCRTYSMVVQNLAASATKNASMDDQHSAEMIHVIKETNVMDSATGGEQNLEAEYSSISLVEKQSFEPDCQENCLIVEKDLEAHTAVAEDEVAESIFVYEEKEDNDYDNDIDKDDAVEEVEYGISEGDQDVESIELMKSTDEDEEKGNKQIMYFQEQLADTDTQTDQITKKCNLQMQVTDEERGFKESDKASSCFEEAISGNSSCGTDRTVVQKLAASAIRNASLDDQHCAKVIKQTNACDSNDQCSAEVIHDIAASREQSLKAEQSPFQLVEKQSSEPSYGLEEDREASETQDRDIAVVDKDLEVHSTEEDDDDYENDIDKDDDAEEIDDDLSEGAENSSEQSNCDKIWSADSNQELLKETKLKEEEEGMKVVEDETSSVEKCNLKTIQNDFNLTSFQQSYDGKDDSAMNAIERYGTKTKLMYLDDVATITTGRRMLLGALLVLIWYLCLKAFFFPPLVDSRF